MQIVENKMLESSSKLVSSDYVVPFMKCPFCLPRARTTKRILKRDFNFEIDYLPSAAELAYVALQTPVLMAVHAAELLPDQVDE